MVGSLNLKVTDEKFGKIKIQLINKAKKSMNFQIHPKVDEELFRSENQIGLKDPTKSFSNNTDVCVLKWRYETENESSIPLKSEYFFLIYCYSLYY